MNRTLWSLLIIGLVVGGGLAQAYSQEDRTLDADASGTAVDQRTGDTFDAELTVDGEVTVTESGQGVDRTAFTQTPITATVTVDDVTYEVAVNVDGEGVSLVQTGVTADGWRLSAQGTSTPGPFNQDVATFRGSLTLLGTDEGYALTGEGTLTVTSGAETTTYLLSYTGTATFE